MLSYHVKLHSYVVVELKATAFKPEYAGKLNFTFKADNIFKIPRTTINDYCYASHEKKLLLNILRNVSIGI